MKTEMFASPRENAGTMEIRQHLSQSLESCKKYMTFDISSGFVRPRVNEKLAFSKLSTLTSVFEKMRFPSPFSSDTCGQGLSLFPWLHCHENMIASDNEIK